MNVVKLGMLRKSKRLLFVFKLETFFQFEFETHFETQGLPWWLSGKESAYQYRRHGLNSWIRKNPLRMEWYPRILGIPEFLPGKSHGQRSLKGYSSWGRKRVRHDLAIKQQYMGNQDIEYRQIDRFVNGKNRSIFISPVFSVKEEISHQH